MSQLILKYMIFLTLSLANTYVALLYFYNILYKLTTFFEELCYLKKNIGKLGFYKRYVKNVMLG